MSGRDEAEAAAAELGLSCPLSSRRRHAAGEDPAKRDQILDGALPVFFENGFDAASMNDICKRAGVSKGTIYVYFADKVELFEALIGRERDALFLGIEEILALDKSAEERLGLYGRKLVSVLCSEHVIRAMRIVIGAHERFPELGVHFYESGATKGLANLVAFFKREIAAGTLNIADPVTAAYHFTELCLAGLWRQRLFGKMEEPPTAEQIDRNVDAAVRVFMAAYREDAATAPG